MTPICVALIRIGFALLGQDDAVSADLTAYPTAAPVCCPAAAVPVPPLTWSGPLPYGGYYSQPPCVVPPGTSSPLPNVSPLMPPAATLSPLSADDTLVRDLMQVLNETKSKETFCLTLEVLSALKGDRKQAIPAVLRNAERLGISRGMLKDSDKFTPAQEVLADSLRRLTEGKGDIRPAATGAVRTAPTLPQPSHSSPAAPAAQKAPQGYGLPPGIEFLY